MKKHLSYLLTCWASVFLGCGIAQAQSDACTTDWITDQTAFSGDVSRSQTFRTKVGDHLMLVLAPVEQGWQISIQRQDRANVFVRPQPSGIPNPNFGLKIIAPQFTQENGIPQRRDFFFGDSALKPSSNRELIVPQGPPNSLTVEPKIGSQGRGMLIIEDSILSDAETSEKTELEWIRFSGCLSWNTFPREPDDDHYGDLGAPAAIASWVVIGFETCGLPKTLLLSDHMTRRYARQRAWLEPDFDGDGQRDLAAIVTNDNQKFGLAICLQADRKLLLVGLGNRDDSTPSSDYLKDADWWHADRREDEAKGDEITIGIEGASSRTIFLSGTGDVIGKWQGD